MNAANVKTILLLEDDRSLAMHWQESLEQQGYRVVHVMNADEAIQCLKESEFDLVISDMLICEGDDKLSSRGGLTLLSHIFYTRQQFPRPKIIAVSGAVPEANLLTSATAMQADKIFKKPVDVEVLCEAATSLIGQSS